MIAIPNGAQEKPEPIQEKVNYCLYARKSTDMAVPEPETYTAKAGT